jgi:predicted metalloprotease with PDZ domain
MRAGIAALLVLLTAGAAAGQPAAGEVAYALRLEGGGSPFVTVDLAWADPLRRAGVLVMPRAIPMGYGEQRYDAFLSDVRASAGGAAGAAAERQEGPRWALPAGTSRVTYRVDLRAMEQAVTGASDASRLRDGYAAMLGYSVLAYVDGFEARPARLRVQGPAGWPVFATGAPRVPATPEPVEVRAPDYYALADGQIVMGPRAVFRQLTASPVPLYLAGYAEGDVDLDRTGRLAVTAFQRVAAYFGTVPFAHYTVHQELLQPLSPRHEYGMSMEHLDSSTYYLAAAAGLGPASTAADEARVLYNFAHHMAHAWVPKRASGEGYFPFQWELAPVLDTIWFAEGFGQYAAIVAVAAGEADPAAFRTGMLARRFQANLDAAPAFLRRLDLVALSRVASTRYSEDFRTGRLVFSRGGLMAAAMDERIQAETRGARSLRDALRSLVTWSARERRGFRVDELPTLVRDATGVDVGAVMAAWLRPLP